MKKENFNIYFKKIGLLFLAAALLFIVFKGVVKRPAREMKDGKIVVQYWEKWTGFEGEAIQEIVDDFNASQDRIFVKILTVSDISQKMMLATAGGNPPDIAGLRTEDVSAFADKGALTPLDGLFKKSNLKKEDYLPIYIKLCEHHGFLWALPSTPATIALHWNKKLFKVAGLDPEKPPKTLRELDEMVEKLTIVSLYRNGKEIQLTYLELTEKEKADKNFQIVQLGHNPFVPGWWVAYWPFWFNGKLWDGKDKITAYTSQNVEAFRWIQSYSKKYGLKNMQSFSSSFGNFSSPQSPFLSGRVAMVIQGVWMYNFIDKYAPQLEWGAAPFPSVVQQTDNPVTLAECDVFVIPKGAEHVKEAFEFICFASGQEEMEKLCMNQRKFPPFQNVSDDFVSNHPNPQIQMFMDLAMSSNAGFTPRMSIINEYADEMNGAAEQVFSLRKSPEEALEYVQNRVQPKLDRVMRRWNIVKERRIMEWEKNDQR